MSEPEAFRERLARLRRDAPVPKPEAQPELPAQESIPAQEPMPVWWQAKMKGKQKRAAERAAGQGSSTPEPSSAKSAGELRDMQRAENEHGPYALREKVHADDWVHGSWKLSAVDSACSADIALLSADDGLKDLNLRQAIYLDVETTGLSGGAGTTSFMVALGSFEGPNFHLWQGFLEGPEQERAMLHEVAERVRAADCVVSFFGKSFDRHRLEDKMRLHHIAPPFAGRPHLDLYHPLNRLYKRSVPNGRLCTMEKTLCDVRRIDDLPGSFAPEAWFDYLGKRAHRLEAVFQHNADDVLSLVTLAAHLGRSRQETCPSGEELSGSPAARALAWAGLHGKRSEPALAMQWLQLALERAPVLLEDRPVAFEAGIWCRQLGLRDEALRRFESLAASHQGELACRALVEVAKLQEHGIGGIQGWTQALAAAERAQELCARLQGGKAARLGRELKPRVERLLAKLDKLKV
jgi:uncharacterized protein YprB with RNaseH-like and TPR domain